MVLNNNVNLELISEAKIIDDYDYEQIIFDLESRIDLNRSNADKLDYLLSISSGIVSGMLDVLWAGSFDLTRGRNIAQKEVEQIVVKIAEVNGCKKGSNLAISVKYLEEKFKIPSDSLMNNFGGSLQHHLRDFAHHPTIIGLIFSLLTQFTHLSYGTAVDGSFQAVRITEAGLNLIGTDIPSKISFGTINWFFHLVSDMAGSRGTIMTTGGTGIPGPILSFAKEISSLPFVKDIRLGDKTFSVFLSKLYNGTLLAKYDSNGKMIKETLLRFDSRGEIGFGIEIGRQAIPVVANEMIVRSFYFIRKFISSIKDNDVKDITGLSKIDFSELIGKESPTLSRMLLISTSVFTSIDIADAALVRKNWLAVNVVGVGRFVIAIGSDYAVNSKARDLKKLKKVYEELKFNTYRKPIIDLERMCLSVSQIIILYNLEMHKTMNDINHTKLCFHQEKIKQLKLDWVSEWKRNIDNGFNSFTQQQAILMTWYSEEELIEVIEASQPEQTWLKLVMLEAMLFEPYFDLSFDTDKKGKVVPSKKYSNLRKPPNMCKKAVGDKYLEILYGRFGNVSTLIKRIRKTYDSSISELKEVHKIVFRGIAIGLMLAAITTFTAGILTAKIAIFLVGSKFAGLSGAALVSASLAYLGGGAIAIGGAGMAGGAAAIIGGGAILGLGIGSSVAGTIGAISLQGKEYSIPQTSKLIVSVKEVFLNEELDIHYAYEIYDQFTKSIIELEISLVDLKNKKLKLKDKDKKEIEKNIENADESVKIMKIAQKNLIKFISSFEVGLEKTRH